MDRSELLIVLASAFLHAGWSVAITARTQLHEQAAKPLDLSRRAPKLGLKR